MSGHELRLLRALRRGPLYDGAASLILGQSEAHIRRLLRSLQRQGYVERELRGFGCRTWKLTAAGEEIVEAMTP